MQDYVNCPQCGMIIDSDFAKSREIIGIRMFFCCENHANIFSREAM